MIKVIKSAKEKFTKTCEYCGCVYEYNLEDVLKKLGSITCCPECNSYNDHIVLAEKEKKPTAKKTKE